MMNPGRLFKYFSPDRATFFSDRLVRYSQLGAFNDPFEGRPHVTRMLDKADLSKFIAEAFQDEIKSSYEKLDLPIRRQVSFSKYSQFMVGFLKGQEPVVRGVIDHITPALTSKVHEQFDKVIGIFCLSENPDDLLMWAHYAGSHTGFVVQFDPTHQYFNARRSSQDEFGYLRRVIYRDVRPSGALANLAETEIFTVKSTHWAYEKEWRILRPLPEATKTIPSSTYPICLFEVPHEAIAAVIFGVRCLPETELAINKCLQAEPKFSHVKIKRARADEAQFLIHIEEI